MQPNKALLNTALLLLMMISTPSHSDYASVNGIQMYYETHGRGTPVVLLHGGYASSDMWAIESWLLSYRYRVIEIDSRGHGRSTDSAAPITYEQMASDTLTLLDQLGINNAHFVGWSDGAVIASQIAAYHPERVNQLVMLGAAFKADAYNEAFTLLLNSDPLFNGFIDLMFKSAYTALNPDPDHWPVFRDKLHELWLSPCYFADAPAGYCLEPLEQIAAPALVVVGENELINMSHTQAIVNSIPGAELRTVAYAGHFLPITRPFLTAGIILDFLNN
ncbi:alpha/beta hydrolase [Marinobacteraceae bacterium S3BR75-40.1]